MPEPPIRPSSVPGQRITGLLQRLPSARVHGDPATTVTGITHDSRQVRTGDIYLARAGAHTHGIGHVREAVGAGAVAVLTDPSSVPSALASGAQCVVEVADPRPVAGPAAAWVYGDPAAGMLVIGITGTNGKTTTAHLVEAGLRAAGRTTGLIGTIETHISGEVLPSIRTTPEATDLQALFAVMRERGVDALAMEVSSHALALDRVAGTAYDVATFTNLSQDHLDFHGDLDDYFAAKARLFTPVLSNRGVVCVDDAWGRRLAAGAGVPVTTVGDAPADWRRAEQSTDASGGRMLLLDRSDQPHEVHIALPGQFNLVNAALAYVSLVVAGIKPEDARTGLAALTSIPGRMERVDAGQPFVALVDYAHTPDAVAALLAEARRLTRDAGRVLAVLGCGGDRDRGKRPLMGAAAARTADVVVLTNDNPRSEDPHAILTAMAEGARLGDAEVVVEPDRRQAIELAARRAVSGDVLVIAGKGHEQGQEYADHVAPFDDRVVLRETLAAQGFSRGAA